MMLFHLHFCSTLFTLQNYSRRSLTHTNITGLLTRLKYFLFINLITQTLCVWMKPEATLTGYGWDVLDFLLPYFAFSYFSHGRRQRKNWGELMASHSVCACVCVSVKHTHPHTHSTHRLSLIALEW